METKTLHPVREPRTRVTGTLHYFSAPEEKGRARWQNVSRTGASIHLGRYLRPGRRIALHFETPHLTGATFTVEGRIIWCRPLSGSLEFVAGLELLRDVPDAVVAFASVGYAAREKLNKTASARVDEESASAIRANGTEVPKTTAAA
jgi:hypothetical protein